MTKIVIAATLMWGLVFAIGIYFYVLGPAVQVMQTLANNLPK